MHMCKVADKVNKILGLLLLTFCVYIINDKLRAIG